MCLGLSVQIWNSLNTRRSAEPDSWPRDGPRAPNHIRLQRHVIRCASTALLSAPGAEESVLRQVWRHLFGAAEVYFKEEAVDKLQPIDVSARNELAHPKGKTLLLGLVAIWWGDAGRRAERILPHAESEIRILEAHLQHESPQGLVGFCLATVPALPSSSPALDYFAPSKAQAERPWEEVTQEQPPATSQQMQRALSEAWSR